ncbi:hypothetical protein [Kitasatospora sp. NPDC056531]|uniref:hypothetical protein n=1 Tax=Kitasatospora sp. NPDC056531 TaxID=3345856 RepID=UPI0036B8B4B9
MTRPAADQLDALLAHRLGARFDDDDDDFDIPAALRRISSDVAGIRARRQAPLGWWAEQSLARACLDDLARTAAGQAGLAHIAEFAVDEDLVDGESQLRYEGLAPAQLDQEIEAFRIYRCLLHLVGHSASAQFWWQLGAGAGDQTSAHILFLFHLGRGELALAKLWFERAVEGEADPEAGIPAPSVPDVDDYFRSAPVLIDGGRPEDAPSPDVLADEVSRLVARADDSADDSADSTDGIVTRPSRRLADRIEEMAGLR